MSTILYVDEFLDSQWSDYNLDLITSRSTGMRVMIHPPGTIPNMKLGISVGPGTETTITLSQTTIIHLPAPYSNCTLVEVLGSPVDNYTYTDAYCFEVCLQNQYLAKCGCIYSTLQFTTDQFISSNNTFCGKFGISKTQSSSNWNGLGQLVCAVDLPVDRDSCNAACLTPCRQLKYATSVTAAPWPHISAQASFYFTYLLNTTRFGNKFDEYLSLNDDVSLTNASAAQVLLKKLDKKGLIQDNFLQLNVRFDTSIYMEQKDVVVMSLDALGAQIGGVLSLWLGVTIILIFELCEFMFHLLVICYRAKKGKQSTDTQEKEETKQ